MPSSLTTAAMWSCVGPMNVPPMSAIWPLPMSSLRVRPPTRLPASMTITDLPPARTFRAAVRPAMPAPTTITSALRFGRERFAASAGTAVAAPAAALAAPALISVRRVTPTRRRLRRLALGHADVVGQGPPGGLGPGACKAPEAPAGDQPERRPGPPSPQPPPDPRG